MNIKENIERLKTSLIGDNEIRLLHFGQFPGLPMNKITDVEQEFFPFPDTMKQLYAYSNGLVVVWEGKDDKPTEWPGSQALENPDWQWTLNSYQTPRGLINILPLDKVFYEDWKDVVWFDGKRKVGQEELDAEAFKMAVKPFDLYSKYNSVCLFSTNGKVADCVLGDDHNADFESYEPVSFDRYLQHLLKTRGDQKLRTKIFKPLMP